MGRSIFLRAINALIDSERNLIISPSEGFVGEHNAEIIVIDIGPFAQENYSFFVLNFDNGISDGTFQSNIISTADDKPAYIDNGVIYCPIIAQHTASGTLKIQLEAHKTVDERVTVRKSSVACISFGESLMGQLNALDESNPVYERLADAEGRIASAESRIADIEKENFGAAIDGVEDRVTELEGKADTADRFIETADSRISAIESFEIPKKLESVNQRVDELENDFENFDALTSIPAADDKTLGGVKISENSEVFTNFSGSLGLRYGNIDMHAIVVLLVLALLHKEGTVETAVGNTVNDISSVIYSNSAQIIGGSIEAVAFSVFENGEMIWLDENYEERSTSVRPNAVYVIRLVDERAVIESYSGNELRGLILEGI